MLTKEDIERRRSQLSAEKQALLEKRLRRMRAERAQGIARRSEDGPAPLSFGQHRLWVLDQLAPGNPFYNIPIAVQVAGALDVAALERSLNTIIQRHEVLRTTFPSVGGQPIQAIAVRLAIPLPIDDLQGYPEHERGAEALRRARDEALRVFDIAAGPLLRARLLRLAPDDHILLLTMHHMVSDGWSMGVIIREIVALYEACVAAGRGQGTSPLPPLPIQYADFAVWQRAWLQGAILQQQTDYWQRQLAGDLPVLELPFAQPRPLVQSYRGATPTFLLPASLSQALGALSRRAEGTLFMTLLAAFQTLLYRYTGQDDIVVGSPIANRKGSEVEPLIGFFVNTLVLRADLSGDPRFVELLARVKRVTLEAYAHQDLPFEHLVELLQPVRDPSRSPIVQVLFTLQNTPLPPLEVAGLTIRPLEIDNGTARFDLSLAVTETPAGLKVDIEHNTDLFDAAAITRMFGHLHALLTSIAADPQQRIGALPLLAAGERQQLLVEWNDTRREVRSQNSEFRKSYGASELLTPDFWLLASDSWCIHTLVERQVAQRPDAVALVFEDVYVTYAVLNRHANQLAHSLMRHGIGPNVLVGLCVERSIAMIVGMLGILKAGGAYVPIDPAYPAERIAFMLEDTRAPVLITNSIYDLRLTIDDLEESQTSIVNRKSKIVNLDADWPQIARESAENLAGGATAANLAYVIYTSGSTGRPKGTLIAHGSVCNFINSTQTLFPIDARDHVLQFAACTFDVSVFEIFSALLSGATLHLARREVVLSPPALSALMRDHVVTVIDIPPIILEQLPAGDFPALRIALIGGESFTGELATRWQAPRRRFFNGYGPTESTVTMTLMECVGVYTKSPPIGRPMPNHQVYILDRNLEPVPLGVPGELHISGAGLAQGYLRRPELTAERFVPNPFVTPEDERRKTKDEKGGLSFVLRPSSFVRLYRTGDLVRWLPDGTIEFLGRIDHQVKIRGFRIELEEIAAVLRQHPAVGEAAVVVREDIPGNKRLAAYVVPTNDDRPPTTDQGPPTKDHRLEDKERGRGGEGEDSNLLVSPSPPLISQAPSFASDLRDYLKQKLPEYMLPTGFVLLDRLPLTSSGKLDRTALPAPDPARPALEDDFVGPRTPIEQALAEVWQTVLGIDQVGIHDNFFLLGGDSLLSLTMVGQANQAGIQLSAQQVFQYQTIAELAAVAGGAPEAAAEQSIVTGQVPLTAIQRWFFEQELPQPQHWNQSLLLEVAQPLDPAIAEQTLAHLLQHHDALRMRFTHTAAGWEQDNAAYDDNVPLTWLNLPGMPAELQDQAIATLADSLQASLDLSEGPLLRAAFFDLGPDRPGRLLLIIHHLVVDGVSWRVLLEDFQAVYRQLSAGEAPRLPAKTTSFKQWAEQLTRQAQTVAALSELDYWLAAAPDRPAPLPTDALDASAENTAGLARTYSAALSAEETRLLLQTLPKLYQTQINAVLLTALAHAFAAWTGRRTLLIELEGHGREDVVPGVDLSRTVGWFTSTFPVLLDLGESDDSRSALLAIDQQLQRIPNRGIGYGLVRYLHDDPAITGRLSACPQPEVSFNYLGQSDQVAGAGGLFRLADGPVGPQQDPQSKRAHLIEIVGLIADHQLRIDWIYNERIHHAATIARLASDYIAALRRLIAASAPDSARAVADC